MKLLAAGLALAVVLAVVTAGESQSSRCRTGEAQGFLSIRTDPPHLVGTLPSRFTGEALYFDRRYNCTGRSAQARRVDLGVYEVRFPGLEGRVVVVSALSQEGVTTSVLPLDGIYRIALRGPLSGNDVAERRDVPFSIVLF